MRGVFHNFTGVLNRIRPLEHLRVAPIWTPAACSASVRAMEPLPDPPKTAAAAMASPLLPYAAWYLSVHCAECRQISRVDIDRVYKTRPRVRMVDLVACLRCRRCGSPPASVRLSDAEPFNGRADVVEIELLGRTVVSGPQSTDDAKASRVGGHGRAYHVGWAFFTLGTFGHQYFTSQLSWGSCPAATACS
jgi:hypothetical protein